MQQHYTFLIPHSPDHQGQGPVSTHGSARHLTPGLGLHAPDLAVHEYFAQALTPSTAATYHLISNHYLEFCTRFIIQPLYLQQDNITNSVAHLAHSGITYQSIRSYFSGVQVFQVASGLPYPCLSSIPILEYVLRDVYQLP